MPRNKTSILNTVLISACLGIGAWSLKKTATNSEDLAAIKATVAGVERRLDRIQDKMDRQALWGSAPTNRFSLMPRQFHGTHN